jgi:23S rRNA (uracil1939-C5)-methyltransferase
MTTSKQLVTLQLTAMSNGPYALGKIQTGAAAGQTVFARGGIAGEQVQVQIELDRGKIAFGRVHQVLQPVDSRVSPACTATLCECSYSHITYPAQLLFKQTVLRQQLQQIAKIPAPPVLPTLAATQQLGWQTALTLLPTQWSDLAAWQVCTALHPALRAAVTLLDLEAVPTLAAAQLLVNDADQVLLTLLLNDTQAPDIELDAELNCAVVFPGGQVLPIAGEPGLVLALPQLCQISAGRWHPSNLGQLPVLQQTIASLLGANASGQLLQLGSHAGIWLLPLAAQWAGVTIIAESEADLPDLEVNLAEFANIAVYAADSTETLAYLQNQQFRFDASLLLPTAAGLVWDDLRLLAEVGGRQLVYLSWDVATFARDTRRLVELGFDLQHAQPVDVAPNSHQFALLALFTRNE